MRRRSPAWKDGERERETGRQRQKWKGGNTSPQEGKSLYKGNM